MDDVVESEKEQARIEFVRILREMADFLEANPEGFQRVTEDLHGITTVLAAGFRASKQ